MYFYIQRRAIERNIVQSAVMDENVDLNNIAYHSICQEAFNNTYKNVFDLSIDESSTKWYALSAPLGSKAHTSILLHPTPVSTTIVIRDLPH